MTTPQTVGAVVRVIVVGDPIVIGHTKYRVRQIHSVAGVVRARTSFGDRWAEAAFNDIAYDKRDGVWRAPCAGCVECAE